MWLYRCHANTLENSDLTPASYRLKQHAAELVDAVADLHRIGIARAGEPVVPQTK